MMSSNTSTAVDLATLYTPGQLDLLTHLRTEQVKLGLSDSAFVREHLTISQTVWSRLNSGTYPADHTAAFVRLDANLRQLRVKLARNAKLTGGRPFYPLPLQRSVIEAVTTCKLKAADDPNRLVTYLAKTGGGKTALGRELKIMHDGILVEGRESWRKSYFAAVCDIARASGVSESELAKGESAAEVALLKRLNANRQVLIIDEGEYFGPRTINLVKLILNQSATVVVVLAIPELFARWQKAAWLEAQQINRRAEAIVELEVITPEEVAMLCNGTMPAAKAEAQRLCAPIAKAANEFGAYDLVTRVVAQLAEDEQVTAVSIEQAICRVKKLLNRSV